MGDRSKEFVTQKVIILKGATPDEWMGTDWWTPEQWERHHAYQEELKAKGEFLKPEEYTVSVSKELLDHFTIPASDKPMLSNFAFLMPANVLDNDGEKVPVLKYFPDKT